MESKENTGPVNDPTAEVSEKSQDAYVLIRTISGFFLLVIAALLKDSRPFAVLIFLIVPALIAYGFSLFSLRPATTGIDSGNSNSERLLLAPAEEKSGLSVTATGDQKPAEPAPAGRVSTVIEVAKAPSAEETAPEKLD